MSSTDYKEQSETPSRERSALPSSRFARACTRCRQQKLACKPGSSGIYPCLRCEDTDSQCVLVEKQRPTPAPTLSSKISRQEASLSDLTSQLSAIQRQLASLSDVQSRLTALERHARASTVQSSAQNAYYHPSPARTDAASSSRRPPSQGDFSPIRTVTSVPRRDENEGRTLVRDFESGDIGSNRLLTDVRMYLSGRGTKRKKVEDDPDAWLMAIDIFNQRCLSAVNFCDPEDLLVPPHEMRDKSPLLFWAIVAVGSRETAELYDVYENAHENMLSLLRETLGGPKPTLWDLIGAMVWNKWLSPVRPIGHIVDLAYELDLHRAYDTIKKKTAPLEPADLAKVRMWISVCIQDFFSATMTGRPPHYQDRGLVLEQAKWLVNQPGVLRNDWRLFATYEYENIAHSIQEQTSRVDLIGDDWRGIIESRLEAIDDWYARWEPIARTKSEPEDTVSFAHSIKINVHLAKLAVLSVFLRGIRTVADLTPERLRYIGMAVECARAECHVCVTELAPAIQYLAETQLYGFASAAVLLLKVVWLLPQAYDSEQIFREVEDVIDTLRAISGQLHAHFVSQILRHVRENHRVGMARMPTLMPAAEEYTTMAKSDLLRRVSTPLAEPLPGQGGNDFNGVNGHETPLGVVGGGFNTGEVNNDFWNWLSSTGQAFSSFPTGFEGLDTAIGLGGV